MWIGAFASLIATYVLTLTSVAFNAALSGAISTAFGIQTVADIAAQRLAGKDRIIRQQMADTAKRRAAVRKFGNRLSARTKRVATRSVAAIPAEAIPYLGIAVLITGTAYELYEACQSVQDLEILYDALSLNESPPEGAVSAACDPVLSSASSVWDSVKDQADTWYGSVLGEG
ncbi:MAG: hypothetical protein HRT76_09130 [Halieaceae bacterium]|nr:hypothetical protein [Halieaceae bacterium]